MSLSIELGQFTGSMEYYATTLRGQKFVCTDGMLHLAEVAGAYWLLDAVSSYQSSRLDRVCEGFQVWQLRKLPDSCKNSAELTCWRDTPSDEVKPFVRQLIPYADFPFDELGESFQFYACGTMADRITAMLKSEY